MEKENIINNLVTAGTPFIVGDAVKDTKFPPGTKGYVSHLEGPEEGNHNVMFLNVVIIRRGKTGKARLNKNVILCPVFTAPINTKELFPPSDERKNFVDLQPIDDHCDALRRMEMDDVDFMGWLLARVNFLRKMDSAMYQPDNPIITTIGLQGPKQMTIWSRSKNAESMLLNFNNRAEAYYNEGRLDYLHDEFCRPEKRVKLLDELFKAEACLCIPGLEYKRLTSMIARNALDHLKELVKDDKGDVKTIGGVQKEFKAKEEFFAQLISTRLGKIKENRQILKL